MPDTEHLSVDYTLTRGQVWRGYGRLWLRSLWPIDVGLAFLGFVVVAELSANIRTLSALAMGVGMAVAWLLLTLSPVIAYAARAAWPTSMQINRAGIVTSVPRLAGTLHQVDLAWADTTAIDELDGGIVFRSGGRRGFIVPSSAFATLADRDAFARQAQAWRLAAKG